MMRPPSDPRMAGYNPMARGMPRPGPPSTRPPTAMYPQQPDDAMIPPYGPGVRPPHPADPTLGENFTAPGGSFTSMLQELDDMPPGPQPQNPSVGPNQPVGPNQSGPLVGPGVPPPGALGPSDKPTQPSLTDVPYQPGMAVGRQPSGLPMGPHQSGMPVGPTNQPGPSVGPNQPGQSMGPIQPGPNPYGLSQNHPPYPARGATPMNTEQSGAIGPQQTAPNEGFPQTDSSSPDQIKHPMIGTKQQSTDSTSSETNKTDTVNSEHSKSRSTEDSGVVPTDTVNEGDKSSEVTENSESISQVLSQQAGDSDAAGEGGQLSAEKDDDNKRNIKETGEDKVAETSQNDGQPKSVDTTSQSDVKTDSPSKDSASGDQNVILNQLLEEPDPVVSSDSVQPTNIPSQTVPVTSPSTG